MGPLVSGELLSLPVRSHGIELGRPVELLLDLRARRVLGFEVRCRDGIHRFLPLAATRIRSDEIAIESALTMLDELAFYRARGRTLGSLRGSEVANAGGALGTFRDVVFEPGGAIHELVVATPAGERRVSPSRDVRIAARRASAA